jgi:hypothetical protein
LDYVKYLQQFSYVVCFIHVFVYYDLRFKLLFAAKIQSLWEK